VICEVCKPRKLRRNMDRSAAFSIRSAGKGTAAATGLRIFRVYRHNSAAVYREAITRRNCDSLSGVALMALPAGSAKATRS